MPITPQDYNDDAIKGSQLERFARNAVTRIWNYVRSALSYNSSTGRYGISISGTASTADKLVSPTTAGSAITGPEASGCYLSRAYRSNADPDNGYPEHYGNIMTIGGLGGSQLFLTWSGENKKVEKVYYRNRRDNATTDGDCWSPWKAFAWDDHTHDGRYYTETEINGKLPTSGSPTISYAVNITGSAGAASRADGLTLQTFPQNPGVYKVPVVGEDGAARWDGSPTDQTKTKLNYNPTTNTLNANVGGSAASASAITMKTLGTQSGVFKVPVVNASGEPYWYNAPGGSSAVLNFDSSTNTLAVDISGTAAMASNATTATSASSSDAVSMGVVSSTGAYKVPVVDATGKMKWDAAPGTSGKAAMNYDPSNNTLNANVSGSSAYVNGYRIVVGPYQGEANTIYFC